MAIQIGINGFGRIGRVAFRIAIDKPEEFHLCGINVRNANLEYMVYMIRYDSIFGRFQGTLDTYENGIVVNGQKIPVYSESDAEPSTSSTPPALSAPQKRPWRTSGQAQRK